MRKPAMTRTMSKSKKRKKVIDETVVGVVTPVQWDGEAISAVALDTFDGEVYRIDNGEKFFYLANHTIEATGRIRRDKRAHKCIAIKRFNEMDAT